ncbi:MAG: DAK2 domain-containing protein [bacterium]|nr:DAK2 domain-containing protein [bacterium]
MSIYYCDGKRLKFAVCSGTHWLTQNKEVVNSLNVFPIPDGDTGTNMSLTLQKVTEALENTSNDSLPYIAQTIANNSLLGARGSSGVILSQILQGLAEGIGDKLRIDSMDLAKSLKISSEKAYSSIDKPAEGTILTLLRETANSAVNLAHENKDIITILRDILETGEEVLIKTQNLLPELKKANVVDAGGQGLLFIIEGVLKAIDGDDTYLSKIYNPGISGKPHIEKTIIEEKYCLDFLLMEKVTEELNEKLKTFGSEVIIASSNNLLSCNTNKQDISKIHIHTNTPDKVIETVRHYGKVEQIKIEDMEAQHSEFVVDKAILAVVPGDGFGDIFKKLNVRTLAGGQTMNPSVAEIKSIIDSIKASTIFLLPNNGNIIAAAKKAGEHSNKKIHILSTKTIPEGISAVMAFSHETSVEENIERMESAINRVKSGEITKAVRDSKINGMEIKKGNYIGIYNDSIVNTGKKREQELLNLLKTMITDDDTIISIFYQSQDEDIESLCSNVGKAFPELDIETYYGGQPHYDYIISVE